MSETTRIPRTIAEFDRYINATDEYQLEGTPVTNGARLGMTPTNQSDWTDKREFWRDTLYPQYSNPLTSTSAVKGNVKVFMDNFHTFGNPILNVLAASPTAVHDDEVAFNFKIGRHEPTHRTVMISEAMILGAIAKGGGDIHFTGRTSTDATRASKPAGSDSLQLAFMIREAGGSTPTPGPIPTPENFKLPSPDSSDFTKEILTKASTTVHFGTDNQNKILIAAARWFNTKHPELAGTWSSLVALIIS